ncbi:hypothetical protein [Sedimentitalea todarodis]|uniref:Uncharacterized protein n=1 Tax=Sedimentitalea todarodis TaxID=1631240 RepID=A0ABU3VAU3_9RHOB|nr:hypothetical protein [Sedimentitalea todarodis]MDU9003300.1 hypothetical protein [Sedimentitalea todarodis]
MRALCTGARSIYAGDFGFRKSAFPYLAWQPDPGKPAPVPAKVKIA